jgi:hypothetical protein
MPEKEPTARAAPVEAPRAATKTAAAPEKTYYQVIHGAVGQWEQGAVISSDDLFAPVYDKNANLVGTQPIDVERLLRLGAIAVTTAPAEPIADDAPPAE